MRIALDLTDNFSVELGETREELIYKLDENKIAYTIPFDKTLDELDKSNRAVKETIISIKEFGLEISIHNDIVVYIKERTGNNTTIYKISDNKQCSASDIVKVMGIIADKFNVSSSNISIEKLNMKNLDTIIVIRDDNKNIRVHLRMAIDRSVYISTVRYV